MFDPLILKIVLFHKHSNDLFYFNIAPNIESILCATPHLNFMSLASSLGHRSHRIKIRIFRLINFFHCGGVAHKMDSNFTMLGAMLK